MLSLGWSDGRSFLPLAFSLLGSAKEEKRFFGAADTDGRTSGARRRKEAVMKTSEAALILLDAALGFVNANLITRDSRILTTPVILPRPPF